MGFATGFTGGVTLTLSLAYLSVLAHQRTRENQSRHLRAQALALQTLVDPIPQPLPPSRSEVAAAQRAASVEVAKDRWNEEVENAVRWVQNTDWVDVREDLEARVAGLWARAFGGAVDGAEKAGEKLEPAARQAEAAAREAGSSIASAGKAAFDKAKERGARYESTMEDKALEARLTGRRQIEKAEAEAKKKASEAQGVIASALEKGRDKAHEVVDKVKTAVGLAEEKAAAAAATVDGKAQSPVAKALQQRYEKPEAKINRTVAEVLQERYTPIDKRDNTVLRGL
ncbi:hypothetical protein ACCO45_005941 [Purpureocillium lilacinum]|uniref:Uncharacterized protein n=1 Tax=Purpureocillium lilacinum TaxID=33203 RepID=A0ACC4DZ54_PURLI